MKTLKNKLVLAIVLLCGLTLSAQNVIFPIASQYNGVESNKYDLENWNSNQDYYSQLLAIANTNGTKVLGDKFLYPEFFNGTIINYQNSTKAKADLRYNIYSDVFEISLNSANDQFKKLKKDKNYQFILNEEKFVLIQNSLLDGNSQDGDYGYVVELYNSQSKTSLFKKYKLKFKIGSEGESQYHPHNDSEIIDFVDYFIKIDDRYQKVELNKNKIARLFDDHKAEIVDFIDHRKFNFRGANNKIENQLVQVVRYYNSL
jgi:hypothetical protein